MQRADWDAGNVSLWRWGRVMIAAVSIAVVLSSVIGVVRATDATSAAAQATSEGADQAQIEEQGRDAVPPLLLDPRPDAHAKTGKPAWTIDPHGAIRWVIVVRHAEKASEPEADPPLSEQGERRAKDLERMLIGADPTLLLGTELIRTQRTLEPLAAELGLLVDVHESDDPYGMAAKVLEMERPVSVVAAHSDTVVPILEGLTQLDLQNLYPIEYDDFFVVAIAPGVERSGGRPAASVLRLKYGCE
ncbi:MAG: histidine phosphatase family protein [Candidatus Eisenbacteria bacterium]|uniref:Histidine phosphatase family protein n=1 Tax=Eiseniibacteriota bacterium TaxID=2212470 RepID=A0A956NDV6_UNCEI|nr:histidine phosphatase family protein [Candidatus Eisenbacteria bacterium]MCB9463680.1 histidine phosphatase family protein [Candidatus Eisenbacteria bacterium]